MTRAVSILCAVGIAACRGPSYPAVPGDTAFAVTHVSIVPRDGEQLQLSYAVLRDNLGLRPKSVILPARDWNAYRLAEDRRRIEAFLMENGRFEAAVDEPLVAWNPAHTQVAVTWPVHEGPAYAIGAVTVLGAPPERADELRGLITFAAGDRVNLPLYRPQRFALADRLQAEGYAHARAYSRAFVDRTAKTVAWFFYVDPGPATRIRSVAVEGNDHEPSAALLARAGLEPGKVFSSAEAKRAELALLDTGAFASVNVTSDADAPHLPEWPEVGGSIAPEQIAADGTLVPRTLPSEVAVRVVVVEAPQQQVRGELGVEGDPTRIDAFTGARAVLRNLFGPQHHLVLEGSVGYGWIFGDDRVARGVYGSALAQYVHGDLRVTARWRDAIYPDALLREVVAGPGVHHTLAPGVFVSGDAFFRFGRQIGYPMFDRTSQLALATSNDATGLVLEAAVVADRRDDRVEPTRGWLLGSAASYAPGGPLGDHRWLQLTADARGFVPIDGAWSIAGRASGGWVGAGGVSGIPLGPRLFGGGAYGMRGFGRDRLSPSACATAVAGAMPACDVLVGGRSLVEASAELRWLPYRKQFGAAVFVDAGQAGAGANPFGEGVALAAGLGGRLRLWYVPIAIDVAYRFFDGDRNGGGLAWDRLLAFVRIGEAF